MAERATAWVSKPSATWRVLIRTAFAIAHQFPHRLPTVEELQDAHGMSRATAYRWLADLKQARGGSHAG
ncbi:hypothetical protein [Lysobacter olei]